MNYAKDVLGMAPEDVKGMEDVFFNTFNERHRKEQIQKQAMRDFMGMF